MDNKPEIPQDVGRKEDPAIADKLFADWRNSVVKIKTDSGLGTGFFVDENTIATNYHVIKDSRNFAAQDSSMRWYTLGEKVYGDPLHDLALITVHGVGPEQVKPIPIAQKDIDYAGARLYHLGHPLGRELRLIEGQGQGVADQRTYSRLVSLQVKPQERMRLETMLKNPANESYLSQPLIMVDAPGVTHGSSGAPFLDESGNVVAVVRKGDLKGDKEDTIYCAPALYLRRLIENSKQPGNVDLPRNEFFESSGQYETGIDNYFSSLRHTPKTWFRESIPLGIATGGAVLSRYDFLDDLIQKKSGLRVNSGLCVAGFALAPLAMNDISRLNNARDQLTRTKYELSLGADATMAAGFAQMTLANATKARFGGRIGAAIGIVGIAGRVATEFIPNHYSVTIPQFEKPR
jgi:hypothetical protein